MYDQSAYIVPPNNFRRLVDSTFTDETGRFTFKPVATLKSFQIECVHPAYHTLQIGVYSLKDTSVTILMVAAGSVAQVTGTVYQACKDPLGMPCITPPLPGCTVTVYKGDILVPILWQTGDAPIQSDIFRGVTDKSGKYTITNIPVSYNAEPIAIGAYREGFLAQSVDTSIRTTMTTSVNFVLSQENTVPGTKDSVYITPVKPTTADSIRFNLYNAAHCCVTKYSKKSVTVSDTVILLYYIYDDSMCQFVRCLTPGSITEFPCGPLKAGKYAVYKQAELYCPPPRICPDYVPAPVRVGTVTVQSTAAIKSGHGRADTRMNSVLVCNGSRISAFMRTDALGEVALYDARGIRIAVLYSGWMAAGSHQFGLPGVLTERLSTKTYLVTLSINGTVVASQKIFYPR
jgi:hypothetical protein